MKKVILVISLFLCFVGYSITEAAHWVIFYKDSQDYYELDKDSIRYTKSSILGTKNIISTVNFIVKHGYWEPKLYPTKWHKVLFGVEISCQNEATFSIPITIIPISEELGQQKIVAYQITIYDTLFKEFYKKNRNDKNANQKMFFNEETNRFEYKSKDNKPQIIYNEKTRLFECYQRRQP